MPSSTSDDDIDAALLGPSKRPRQAENGDTYFVGPHRNLYAGCDLHLQQILYVAMYICYICNMYANKYANPVWL